MSDPSLSIVDGGTRRLPQGTWCDLFERQARRTPSRRCLVTGETSWTFRELDVWSDRLARVLRDAGAVPGSVVACGMTRSVRAVLGVLATAKTGAVQLPIDPVSPVARVDAILGDARPAVVLTDAASLASRADVVLSDEDWEAELARRDGHRLPRGAAGPAYIIYTSGSTGAPKGVMVGHRSLVNLYGELADRFFPASRGPQRVAHGLPLSFDASWNPLSWLAGGHELHLVPDSARMDPESYVDFVREHRLSVVEAVPAQMSALLAAGLLDGRSRPRLLLMGGEAIGQELWSQLREAPDVTAVNLYGPTECTVFTTACRLDERATPSIGRPIGNTAARVVDEDLRPVPIGEPGELLISGSCLALGYLGSPELTADRFVTAGERRYRTGDRCRLAVDGRLEWLGRLDDQVKIRGHRVEPGETEHALLGLPGVRQAVVRAEGAEPRLVAYVVLGTSSLAEVRERLRAVLPTYLLPAAVIPVEAMPLGPNGKIDRTALAPFVPAPSASVLTPEQALVAAAFRVQLGIPAVDADSDFFALGGHSLSAAALAARLRARGVPCSLRDVLLRRTVARLAELVPTLAKGASTWTTTT
ncbi:amino acid adenylation domain-containing protein [Amycolatopsis regifaucium]|uniref:Non-ribosomal peptide synthetase n=1 Tax=Amycolatopsis regifaucium TaxID=546365 RepID=A0A154M5R7_9PSEU|nr:amino acid adenylation domain-containing protein [Amycolatopsis regifaucium]KZB79717.1 non-ribosomal peptide synthetase [Amycolatopsis regifaucium]OKA09968.1 non-ribosomal peptide synthetase [Amycolatopsis regifaucium]SFI66887.1 amino acid adenylation domain-containing protein [Amycolatopsis regifaucium]